MDYFTPGGGESMSKETKVVYTLQCSDILIALDRVDTIKRAHHKESDTLEINVTILSEKKLSCE